MIIKDCKVISWAASEFIYIQQSFRDLGFRASNSLRPVVVFDIQIISMRNISLNFPTFQNELAVSLQR